MRARLIAIALAIGLAGGLSAGVRAAAGPASQPRAVTLADLQGVNFISTCRFSHRLMDDPIVFPGAPGASHDHSFVGNRTTNAFSTIDSLLDGSTTCARPGDTAAYWMPTLLVNGAPVPPRGATIYYRRKTIRRVRAVPRGLMMIAGNSKATAPQSPGIAYWNCGAEGGVPPSAEVPTCPNDRTASLRLHVTFPNCWDGANLDAPDHQSHMAYSRRGICPAGHPVPLPAISLIYRYPAAGGVGVTLASGGVYSAHADFINAWDQGTLESLVQTCLNKLRHCAQGS
jgi:Domain of unknown function (DUF1996)